MKDSKKRSKYQAQAAGNGVPTPKQGAERGRSVATTSERNNSTSNDARNREVHAVGM